MSDYTSFNVGGIVDVMACPKDEDDLRELLHFAERKRFPVYVLGAGTNLLVKDGGIRGVVLNLSEGFRDIIFRGEDSLEVGAGVSLSKVVNICKEKGFSGLEFAEGIPGSVGGAIAMNAGAYGGEMKDVVEGVEIMERDGKICFIRGASVGFSYRGSRLPDGAIILKVRLIFKRCSVEDVRRKMIKCRDRRRKTQAIKMPNAGSIFKNPNGESAGRLIEEAGLKGMQYGGAKISEVHANYIVNLGDANASDIMALMAHARDKVYQLKGIVLEPEIKVIGED
jgi:UDP-N-acetylmuramate dehydrogenase